MQHQLKPRRGNIAILSCALLAVMMGMVAFAVDLGYIAHARTELQRSADAVALAAAAELPNTSAAVSTGIATSTSNGSAISPTLTTSDFEFGWWNRNSGTFITPTPANRRPNAVRVTIRCTQANGNPLNLFYGRVLGRSSTDVTVSSVAWNDRGLCGAFVGIDWLDAAGALRTDSWDSLEGPYDVDAAYEHGSICSDGDITVGGDSLIMGDARAGAGDNIILNGNSLTVTGNLGNRVRPLNMPAVDTSFVEEVNDNLLLPKLQRGMGNQWVYPFDHQGDFVLHSGEVYDMPPGTYYFRHFTINGGATLNLSGETRIYLTGDLTRAGGAYVNNNTTQAGDLQFLMTGGTANITSDNPFYGVLYAPNTDVTIGGSADFFGAAVGRTLKLSGSGVGHYDESLDLEAFDPPNRTTLVD